MRGLILWHCECWPVGRVHAVAVHLELLLIRIGAGLLHQTAVGAKRCRMRNGSWVAPTAGAGPALGDPIAFHNPLPERRVSTTPPRRRVSVLYVDPKRRTAVGKQPMETIWTSMSSSTRSTASSDTESPPSASDRRSSGRLHILTFAIVKIRASIQPTARRTDDN